MTSTFVGSLLSACQFPNFNVVQSGGAGALPVGGMAGAAGTREEGGSPPNDGGAGAGEGAEPATGGKGGSAGSAGAEPCPPDACEPVAPGGWEGPIAFWEGTAAEADDPPDCPPGYTDPTDWFSGLIAPDGECKCTCAQEGQSCDKNTELLLYPDQNCGQSCVTITSPADAVCTTVTAPLCNGSQGTMQGERPTPSGGTCKPSYTPIPDVTWERGARICLPSDLQYCAGPDQVCAPQPPPPYAELSCVMHKLAPGQGQPACPDGFRTAKARLYAEYTDERDCSTCVCSSLTGGSCTGTVSLYNGGDCSGSGGGPPTYTLGNPCQKFDLGPGSGVRPTRLRADYELTPGACSVVTASKPTGMAVESGGSVLVCCK
jgi:hypothetical protein